MSAVANQPFIPICCVCGLVRDDHGLSGFGRHESWSNLGSYLDRYGLRDSPYKLTHTYCPECVDRYVPAGKKARAERNISEETTFKGTVNSITGLILQTIRQQPNCNLDVLVRACPQYTWNQVFLEVDRLSRSGDIELSSPGPGQYTMSTPTSKRMDILKSV